MNCILIKTSGVIKVVNTPSDLKDIQKLLDGYVEVIYPSYMNSFKRVPPTIRMLVDEEGKIKNKDINYIASCCYCGGVYDNNYIAGDVIICNYSMYKGPRDFKNTKDLNVTINVLNVVRDALIKYDYIKLN